LGNDCLRVVDLKTNKTSRYAGRCRSGGNADGATDTAQFYRPHGLLVVDKTVYVADVNNKAIRAVGDGRVSTLSKSPLLNSPRYLTLHPSGRVIYCTVEHGVVSIDLRDGSVQLVAGSTSSPGALDGPLRSARFDNPHDLVFINEHLLIVADHNNHRLRLIDLLSGVTQSICSGALGHYDGDVGTCTLNNPWSLHISGEDLLVGESSGYVRRLPLETITGESFVVVAIVIGAVLSLSTPVRRWCCCVVTVERPICKWI
jgi:hypothetical protein